MLKVLIGPDKKHWRDFLGLYPLKIQHDKRQKPIHDSYDVLFTSATIGSNMICVLPVFCFWDCCCFGHCLMTHTVYALSYLIISPIYYLLLRNMHFAYIYNNLLLYYWVVKSIYFICGYVHDVYCICRTGNTHMISRSYTRGLCGVGVRGCWFGFTKPF